MEEIKKLIHSLDHGIGSVLCNKESLEALKTELGNIRVGADNTDHSDITSMGLMFRDMYHKIVMMDDLLHYVLDDFELNYNELSNIKSELFKKINKENKEVNNDN